MAHRYLHDFGAPEETFARVGVAQRANASLNPNAYFRDPISVRDVLESRMIADPLHLLDCCPENDGACAVVVTTAERAGDCDKLPVLVAGVAALEVQVVVLPSHQLQRAGGLGQVRQGARHVLHRRLQQRREGGGLERVPRAAAETLFVSGAFGPGSFDAPGARG